MNDRILIAGVSGLVGFLSATGLFTFLFVGEFGSTGAVYVQTIVVAVVGIVGFAGVMHQIKRSDLRSRRELQHVETREMSKRIADAWRSRVIGSK